MIELDQWFESAFERAVEFHADLQAELYGVSLEVGREQARDFFAGLPLPERGMSAERWFERCFESTVDVLGPNIAVINGISNGAGRTIARTDLARFRRLDDPEERLVRIMLAWGQVSHERKVEVHLVAARDRFAPREAQRDGRVDTCFVVRRNRESRPRRNRAGRGSRSSRASSDDSDDVDDSGPEPGDAGPFGLPGGRS